MPPYVSQIKTNMNNNCDKMVTKLKLVSSRNEENILKPNLLFERSMHYGNIEV